MARQRQGRLETRVVRTVGLGLTALLFVLLAQTPAQAQFFKKNNTRVLFNKAVEAHKAGKYEEADRLFKELDEKLPSCALPPTESQELPGWKIMNDTALMGRRTGHELLLKAWNDFQQKPKKIEEVAGAIKALNQIPYLTDEDCKSRDDLRIKLHEYLDGFAPPNETYNQVWRNAKDFFQKNDLDSAESACRHAQKLPRPWPPNLFDNPEKMLEKILQIRRGLLTPADPPNLTPPKKSSPLGILDPFHVFGGKDPPVEQPKDPPKIENKDIPLPPIHDQPSPGDNPPGLPPPSEGPPLPLPGDDPGRPLPSNPPDKRDSSASPLSAMRNFFTWPWAARGQAQRNDGNAGPTDTLPTPTPRMSGQELPQQPQGLFASQPNNAVVPVGNVFPNLPGNYPAPAGNNQEFPPANPGDVVPAGFSFGGNQDKNDPQAANRKAQALLLLKDARTALERNDFEKARQFVKEAIDLRATFGRSDQLTPDRVLSEIMGREKAFGPAVDPSRPTDLPVPPSAADNNGQAPPTAPHTKKTTPTEARLLVRQARDLLKREEFDEAERLIAQASDLHFKGWGLFEDSPDKLRNDLVRLRSTRDRERADQLLIEARKLYKLGDYAEAKKLAYEAQQLHGPYGFLDLGDRPQRLLSDIERIESAQQREGKGAVPGKVVSLRTDPTDLQDPLKLDEKKPPFFISGTNLAAFKARALSLMSEARRLQGNGSLLEALALLKEAEQIDVSFADNEDNPQAMKARLMAQCGNRLNQMLAQSVEFANNNQDPARFENAMGVLTSALQLCQGFGMDPKHINDRIGWVRQLQGVAGPPRPVLSREQIEGFDLLNKARAEMSKGNNEGARQLALEAFNVRYNIQDQAIVMLRTIEAEETNQVILRAKRTAQAGIEAFRAGDYSKAATILAQIDNMRMLDGFPNLVKDVREILRSPQMQPEGSNRNDSIASNKGNAGRATVKDSPIDEFGEARNKEKILYESCNQRSRDARNAAAGYFKNENPDQAIAILEEFLARLDTEHIDPSQIPSLRNPIERQISDYKKMVALKKLADERSAQNKPKPNPEELRTAGIQKAQQEAGDLMKQYGVLVRERKFKEAQAVAEQARLLDPDSPAIAAAVFDIKIMIALKINKDNLADNENGFGQLNKTGIFPKNFDANSTVLFDRASTEKALRRPDLGSGIRINNILPSEQDIEDKIRQKRISVNFRDTELKDVIDILHSLSGLNIVPDDAAMVADNISLHQRLNLNVENLTLKNVLDLLLRSAHLTYVVKNDVVYITTERHAQAKPVRMFYIVSDITTPTPDHPTEPINDLSVALTMQRNNNNGLGASFTPVPNSLNPNGLSHGQTVSASGPPLAGLGRFDPQGPISSSVPDGPVTKRQLAEQLINLIQNAVQPESWKSLGGQGTIDFFNGNGDTLVISQTPEIQEDIKGLLTALRKMQEVQVAIEVRVIMVGEQFYETMNMNWSVGINNSSSSSPQISISPFGNPNAGLTNVVNGFTQAGALAPGLSIPSGGGAFSMPPFLGALPGSLATSGGMSLGLAFLSDIQVKMLLEAATGDKRTQELHSPKLTVLDCHTASIAVVKQQMYMTGVSLQQVGAMVQVVPQNNPYPTGITMQVTPVVSPDRHFVRLHLVPKLTSLIDDKKIMMVSVPVPQIFEGPGSGTPLMMQMPFQQPSFEFKEINTTVNVPDGATVILGGLKSVSEVRDEKGVPVLNQIPILGRLFRNQNYARETRCLLIMVTPRIIINEEEEISYTNQQPVRNGR